MSAKKTISFDEVVMKCIGGFFAVLTVVYLCTAAWVQWFTTSPMSWKDPEVIVVQAFLWCGLSCIFIFYKEDPRERATRTQLMAAEASPCLESTSDQDLTQRIIEIFESHEAGLMMERKQGFTMPQIEFLVKATGDWKSDTFDVRDCVKKLVQEGKLKEKEYQFSWNKDCHESECS